MASAELSRRVEKVVGYPPLATWARISGASSARSGRSIEEREVHLTC
jgi:hypothetical protein